MDIAAVDFGGHTPLFIASHKDHVEVVRKLLAAQASLDQASQLVPRLSS